MSESIARLITKAQNTSIRWLIDNLWQQDAIVVVHSLEEQYKSVLAFQIGEAIATCHPFLRTWNIPQARRVGVLNTEMGDLEMGKRLNVLFPKGEFPENLIISDEEFMASFRNANFEGKIRILAGWVQSKQIEVLIWDTVNSVLSAAGNPNSEEAASKLLEAIPRLNLKGTLIVRHDGKPSKDSQSRGSNQRVRGSNRMVEDASLVIALARRMSQS